MYCPVAQEKSQSRLPENHRRPVKDGSPRRRPRFQSKVQKLHPRFHFSVLGGRFHHHNAHNRYQIRAYSGSWLDEVTKSSSSDNPSHNPTRQFHSQGDQSISQCLPGHDFHCDQFSGQSIGIESNTSAMDIVLYTVNNSFNKWSSH